LPQISKPSEGIRKWSPAKKLVSTALVILIVSLIGFSSNGALRPTNLLTEKARPIVVAMSMTKNKTATALDTVSGLISALEARINSWVYSLLAKKETKPEPKSSTRVGIVAFLDEGDHYTNVRRVKEAFSDDVDIYLDREGDSGVIRPIFREGDDTENYAFVMVPIRVDEQNRTDKK